LADVVAVAASNTLCAVCLAYVEGEGLRVLGDVGCDAVFADAAVGQGIGIALIVKGGHAGDTGL
jgi:hypothetical protein